MATPRNPRKSQSTRTAIIILILLLLAVGVYIFTGYDPLGLFRPKPTPTPTPVATPTAMPIAIATPTPGATPTKADWWEVYFTDPLNMPAPKNPDTEVPAGSIEEKLIQRINTAKRSIHIAAFEFNLTPIANALIVAKKRGVEVQWVTDDENGIQADTKKGRGQFKLLQDAGIPIKDDARAPLMHNKFIIFDGQTTWTGATNLTVTGIFENNNNAIVIQSPELAAIFERVFQSMWAGHFADAPSLVDQQKVVIASTPIQALFSPQDRAIGDLVSVVANAKESIRFMAFTYTHQDLSQAMLARARAGVNVAGIFETRQEGQYSQSALLYCGGVPVRLDGNPSTYHHKVIVVDGHVTVTGSLNFTKNADQNNNENTLVIDNPAIAALYLQEFDRNWTQAEGHDPDPQAMKCPDQKPVPLKPLPAASKSAPAAETPSDQPQTTQPPAAQSPAASGACQIKGNIDSAGNKFYYVPGDPGYGNVKIDESQGERMFCSEQEAKQAGWQHKE